MRNHRIVGPGQARDRIQQDHDIAPVLHQALGHQGRHPGQVLHGLLLQFLDIDTLRIFILADIRLLDLQGLIGG